MKKIIVTLFALSLAVFVFGQDAKVDKKFIDWYNKDLKKDKVFGVSAEKAYSELLKGKTPQTIIVAVIDGGTDIYHEDLQGIIWTNKNEIPGNGIDDDHNGYIDDIHGWNFIGGTNGDNVNQDNLELTRVYKKLSAIYGDKDAKGLENDKGYQEYIKIRDKYESKSKEAKKMYLGISKRYKSSVESDSLLKIYLKKSSYTLKDLKKIKTEDQKIINAKANMTFWMSQKISLDVLKEYVEHYEAEYNYQYNLDFNPRTIVGDNYEVNDSPYYGNNDVKGPRSGHGTVVAGNIAAFRNNGMGANGVAANVQLMIIRVVPDGDERDKDVANGILYAINNGAKVINMSFGKSYSPQKQFVDSVLRIANTKDVVLVHAAGNDAENNDVVGNFPENRDKNDQIICNSWITVGASSMKADKTLPAPFSNYGKQRVDVFAPGVDLYGLEPENKYGLSSGTSMASPVVAGVAAVIRSYYPQLTAAEVKEIIVKSAVKFDKMVNLPVEDGDATQINFSELSVSGGVANLYQAILMAEEMAAKKH
jgi:subtilisin family serine protease